MCSLVTEPVIHNMRYLATDVVGAVDWETAGWESESGAIRTFDRRHTSIPIAGPATVVAEADSILDSFLNTQNDDVTLLTYIFFIFQAIITTIREAFLLFFSGDNI